MAIYASLPELKAWADVRTDAEDAILVQALDRAEAWFERICGSRFLGPTTVAERALRAWTDRNGELTVLVASVAPVTAVEEIRVRNIRTQSPEVVLTPSQDDFQLPVVLTPVSAPTPDWWEIRCFPVGKRLPPATHEDLLVTVRYTGGLSTVPDSLKSLILRLAHWIYKLRSAPLGRVATLELGLMEIPLTMPKDLETDLMLWRRPVF